MANKTELVPAPPAAAPSLAANPFDAFDAAPGQSQTAANPFDVFDGQQPPAAPPVITPTAAPVNGGTSTAPLPKKSKPKPGGTRQSPLDVPPPPPSPPIWQQAANDAGNGFNHFAAGIVDGLAQMPVVGGLGRFAQGVGNQVNAQMQEAQHANPVDMVASGLGGVGSGIYNLGQDAFNSLLMAPLGMPPAQGNSYDEMPGARVLKDKLPASYETGAFAGPMALPIGGAGALRTLKFLPAAAADIAGAAGVGGALGYTGSAGQQYQQNQKIDQGRALEDALANAVIAGGAGAAVHGIASKLGAHGEPKAEPAAEAPKPEAEQKAPEEKPQEGAPPEGKTEQKPAAPPTVRQTPRKQYSFIKEGTKAKLEAQDEALRQQPPVQPETTPEQPAPVQEQAPPVTAPEPVKQTAVEATYKDAEGKPHTQAVEEPAAESPKPVEPAPVPVAPKAAAEIPADRNVVWEGEKFYAAKDGPKFAVYERGNDAEPLSAAKHKEQVIASAQKREAGTFQGNRGKRNDLLNLKGSPDASSYQKAVDRMGNPSDDPELQTKLQEIAAAKSEYDQKRADYRAVHDAVRTAGGFSLKTDRVRKLSPEAEQIIAQARKDEKVGPDQFGVEVNADRLPKAEKYVMPKDSTQAAVEGELKRRYAEMQDAKAKFDDAKAKHVPDIIEKRGNFTSNAVQVPHNGQNYNIKFTAKPKSELAGKLPEQQYAEGETEPAHNHRETLKIIETAKQKGVWETVAKKLQTEAYGGDPISALVATASKLKETLDERGIKMDADDLVHLLGDNNTSDIYENRGSPEFFNEFKKTRGALDLALQGVEKLKTADEKHAWQGNRYSTPEEIRSGANGADKLSEPQREGLIKQNEALDNLSDLLEQYSHDLKEEGYTSEFPRSLVGKNRVLSAIDADLKGLDPGKYDSKNFLDKTASAMTRGLYDMYVTGNWGIHQLHLLEGLTVGPAYDPGAFGEAINHLATSKEARDFANSFESSSGNMKRVKEDNDNMLAEKWRALQKKLADTAGKAVGVDNAADKLAHNEAINKIGDVVEGTVFEQGKLSLARTMGAVKAAKEMGYEGGAKQLMQDMTKAAEDTTAMDPEHRLEAAARIAYHMNQMVGYSPGGYSDLNVFGRLGRTKYGTFAKLFTPFTTTAIQQSRVLTKFFAQSANAIGRGDYKTAGIRSAQGMLMLGLISAVGGRAGMPKEFQEILRKVDPKVAKEFMENMDKWDLLAGADKEIGHVTPKLMAYSFLGDSFPTQLINALDKTFEPPKKDKKDPTKDEPLFSDSRMRGALTLAAGLGVSSIADRMGFNPILKIYKALREGSAGSRTQYAFKDGGTLQSAAKQMVAAQKLLKLVGVPIKPGQVDDYLGKEDVPANIPERLYHALSAGESLTAAHLVNAYRDDAAFKDKLSQLDPKYVEKLDRQQRKVQMVAAKAKEEGTQHDARERLQGFWENAFEQYMRSHDQQQTADRGPET